MLKKTVLATLVAASTFGLSGCAGTTEIRASASCQSGAGCKAEASVVWKSQPKSVITGKTQRSGLAAVTSSSTTGDAGLFVIDTSGSTTAIPSTGSVTLALSSSFSGAVLAARTFGWVRSGTEIRLADPAAVNSWLDANSGGADTLDYDLTPFTPTTVEGLNTFATQSVYAGEVVAASTYTWTVSTSDGCLKCQVK